MHIEMSHYGGRCKLTAYDLFLHMQALGRRVRERQEAAGSLGGWSSLDCGGLTDFRGFQGHDLYAFRFSGSWWNVLYHRDSHLFMFEVCPPDEHVLTWLSTLGDYIYGGSDARARATRLFCEHHMSGYSEAAKSVHCGDAFSAAAFVGKCAEMSACFLSESLLLNRFAQVASKCVAPSSVFMSGAPGIEGFLSYACDSLLYHSFNYYYNTDKMFAEDGIILWHWDWVHACMFTVLTQAGFSWTDQPLSYLSDLATALFNRDFCWANSLTSLYFRNQLK